MIRLGHGGRVDGNHAAVVAALRGAGIVVRSLAGVGNGMPDLICAIRRTTVLLEVKDPRQPPNKRKPTKAELDFMDEWPGHAYIVTTPEEAVRIVMECARPREGGDAAKEEQGASSAIQAGPGSPR